MPIIAKLDPLTAVRLAALRAKYRKLVEAKQLSDSDYAGNPSGYFRDVLGCEAYDKQIQIVEMVRDNRRTAIVSCNAGGKDFTSGRIIPWWLINHKPAKVIIIAPTYRQVKDIIWRETRMAFYGAKKPLPGKILDTPSWVIDDENFALGFSTDKPMQIQGFHSPNLLAIVSEAHAVSQAHIDALIRLNPSRLLLTGNPLSMAGEFYDAFHVKAEVYKTLQVSAFETPNIIAGKTVIPGLVTIEDVAERKLEWGENSPLYEASVLGIFPANLEDNLISRAWVDAAIKADLTPSGKSPIPIIACDVARGGADKTVVARRDGGKIRLIWKAHGKDLMSIGGWIGRYLDNNPDCLKRVVIDDVGLGGGLTDRLRELKYSVIAFQGGASAQDSKHYANATAEAWGLMSNAFRDGEADIENDPELVGQLVTRRYKIQSDKRIILESKDDLKRRGGKSPDCGDAVSMTYCPMVQGKTEIASGNKSSRWRE